VPSDSYVTSLGSAEYEELVDAISRSVASALGRSADVVSVARIGLQVRRALSVKGRSLATSAGVDVELDLLPYGGANNLAVAELNALIDSSSASSPLFDFDSVSSAVVAPVCANDVCEVGEVPDAAAGVVGCPADCAFPVVTCPDANGLECNGVGVCASSAAGVGACVCWTGYAGNACDACAPGYVSSNGVCVRLEANLVVLPPESSKKSPVTIIVAVVVGVAALAAFVAVVVIANRTKKSAKGKVNVAPLPYGSPDTVHPVVAAYGVAQPSGASGGQRHSVQLVAQDEIQVIERLDEAQGSGRSHSYVANDMVIEEAGASSV
jgi:hypothetical protein